MIRHTGVLQAHTVRLVYKVLKVVGMQTAVCSSAPSSESAIGSPSP